MEEIEIIGANEHNLKNLSLKLPKNKLIVITGVSGSGKSSLALDTIYAESQRRFIETLSPYARQFMGILEKPNVESISGLSPSVSIEQKTISNSKRSTIGTITEIYDYLRLLFSKVAIPYCYNCGAKLQKQSHDDILNFIKNNLYNKKISILSPIIRAKKGNFTDLLEKYFKKGFIKARIDGEFIRLEPNIKLDRYKAHDIDIVIDNIIVEKDTLTRMNIAINIALNESKGNLILIAENNELYFSTSYTCIKCGISYPDFAPNNFSFNTHYGWCPKCEGIGEIYNYDKNLVFGNKELSIYEGAILPIGKYDSSKFFKSLENFLRYLNIDIKTPIKQFDNNILDLLFYGSKSPYWNNYIKDTSVNFEGIEEYLVSYENVFATNKGKEFLNNFKIAKVCSECNGGRLRKEALHYKFDDFTIQQITNFQLDEANELFQKLYKKYHKNLIAEPILYEISKRLQFLVDIGLGYLSLNRSADTLSGGESQRIRLATQIGTQLSGVLYILDEPSIGLHPSDNIKLINSLKKLVKMDNTVIVVEHDEETMMHSDFLVELGPKSGIYGGELCSVGETKKLLANAKLKTATLEVLRGNFKIEKPQRELQKDKFLILKGARGNNLKNVTLKIPLGNFICITGLSGSGKSTLINETLVKYLKRKIYKSYDYPLPFDSIEGDEFIDKIIEIDQLPIGRTPRSNPATYIGVFTFIRDLFAQLPESKAKGYKPGRFSFNVEGGRCDKCEGDGVVKIEMNYLPPVYVKCDNCDGKRYNKETLQIFYNNKNIADILDLTFEEALEFFDNIPSIKRKIKAVCDVGLGYIKLGQPATTLSGGEAQRIKLATELSKVSTGKTLYVLDEPTTGLHFKDIKVLLNVLNKLVEKGNTVIVIEHNIDVIKFADWIIDLGPLGGKNGGEIIAEGTQQEIKQNPLSLTGKFL
ncbi:MAG TPA: excinuclease ABC subunit UvrA [Ignavibacteriales bacterium]|nr:excinuclease ABC subunit UvrA [Ignavibacteriales bacterium]